MLTTVLSFALLSTAHADEALDKAAEAAIVETIQMTTAGQKDEWIAKYCDPEKRCRDLAAKNDMKAYQLKSAQNYSKACLIDGNSIQVKQKKGELTDPDGALWYMKCEGRALGVPIRLRYVKDADDSTKGRFWFVQLSF